MVAVRCSLYVLNLYAKWEHIIKSCLMKACVIKCVMLFSKKPLISAFGLKLFFLHSETRCSPTKVCVCACI